MRTVESIVDGPEKVFSNQPWQEEAENYYFKVYVYTKYIYTR